MAADLPAASTVTLPPLHAHIPAEAELARLAGDTAVHLSLEEQLRLAGVSLRMLNLPFVVCASASGLPFFLPLNKVGCASAHWSPGSGQPVHANLALSGLHGCQVANACCWAGTACAFSCSDLVGSLGWHVVCAACTACPAYPAFCC